MPASSSIHSIYIPYPISGLFINTWVTAPTIAILTPSISLMVIWLPILLPLYKRLPLIHLASMWSRYLFNTFIHLIFHCRDSSVTRSYQHPYSSDRYGANLYQRLCRYQFLKGCRHSYHPKQQTEIIKKRSGQIHRSLWRNTACQTSYPLRILQFS